MCTPDHHPITDETSQPRPKVPGTTDLYLAFHAFGVSRGPGSPSPLVEQELLPYPEDILLLMLRARPPFVVVFLQKRHIQSTASSVLCRVLFEGALLAAWEHIPKAQGFTNRSLATQS